MSQPQVWEEKVDAMNQYLAHRGPDSEGTWVEGEVAFGHRKLSIIDLSDAGNQPMISACKGMYLFLMEKYIIP